MTESPNTLPSGTALAIDPGTVKCGLAVVEPSGRVRFREVVAADRVVARALSLRRSYEFSTVLVGDATAGKTLGRALRAALPEYVSVIAVPEAFSSQRARLRYWKENPPSGLWRLVPVGIRTPPQPWDDLVAVLLAEEFFARQENG